MGSIAPLALFGFALAAIFFAGAGLRLMADSRRLDKRLAAVTGHAVLPSRFGIPGLGMSEGRDQSEIEQHLRNAGMFDAKAVAQFVWIRLAITLGAGLGVLAVMFLFSGNAMVNFLVAFIAAGSAYIGSKLLLQMRAAKRERRLMAEFPFLLDLILMMLESGISLDQCFRTVASDEQVAVPEHSRLIATLVADLDRGLDYQLAFDRWAGRVGLMGARELASLFRQSLFKGMELVPALREFIIEFSQRRVARARESIGRITVRMVVLMLIFFMPALLIVLAGPPVAAILDTLAGNAP